MLSPKLRVVTTLAAQASGRPQAPRLVLVSCRPRFLDRKLMLVWNRETAS